MPKNFVQVSSAAMANRLEFTRIKKIPLVDQHCVAGYIRECQSLFPSDNAYYNISELIHYTILLFYYDVAFKWETIDDGIDPSNDDTEVHRRNNTGLGWRNAFSCDFYCGIIECKLQLKGSQHFVGVMPSESVRQNAGRMAMCSDVFDNSIGYWTNDGSIIDNSAMNGRNSHPTVYRFNKDEIIRIMLNFEENKVSFWKGDTKQIEISIIPNIPYVIAVSLLVDGSIQYIE